MADEDKKGRNVLVLLDQDENSLRELIIQAVMKGYAAAAREHQAQLRSVRSAHRRQAIEQAVLAAAKLWASCKSNPAVPLDTPEERALYIVIAELRKHEEQSLAGRLGAGCMGGEPADAIEDTEGLHDDE